MADVDPIVWAKAEAARLKAAAESPTPDKLIQTAHAIQFLQENARDSIFYEYAVDALNLYPETSVRTVALARARPVGDIPGERCGRPQARLRFVFGSRLQRTSWIRFNCLTRHGRESSWSKCPGARGYPTSFRDAAGKAAGPGPRVPGPAAILLRRQMTRVSSASGRVNLPSVQTESALTPQSTGDGPGGRGLPDPGPVVRPLSDPIDGTGARLTRSDPAEARPLHPPLSERISAARRYPWSVSQSSLAGATWASDRANVSAPRASCPQGAQ